MSSKFSETHPYIFSVFCDTYKKFIIPPFQRAYAWGSKQINDLWDSICSNEKEYFKGNKKMGKAMDYLHSNKIAFVSQEEHDVIVAFNGFLSHKGVHSLTSEKEYARISKNMAIEIGMFLVQRLKKYLAELSR